MSLTGKSNVLGRIQKSTQKKFCSSRKTSDGNESVVTISYKTNLLIMQDLWQVHYQILLIILQ